LTDKPQYQTPKDLAVICCHKNIFQFWKIRRRSSARVGRSSVKCFCRSIPARAACERQASLRLALEHQGWALERQSFYSIQLPQKYLQA
jgi:hypothetical protein